MVVLRRRKGRRQILLGKFTLKGSRTYFLSLPFLYLFAIELTRSYRKNRPLIESSSDEPTPHDSTHHSSKRQKDRITSTKKRYRRINPPPRHKSHTNPPPAVPSQANYPPSPQPPLHPPLQHNTLNILATIFTNLAPNPSRSRCIDKRVTAVVGVVGAVVHCCCCLLFVLFYFGLRVLKGWEGWVGRCC